MNTSTFASLFVSHGSPMIALQPGAAGAFMQRLGPVIDRTFGRPRAILAVSAHTQAPAASPGPLLLAAAQHAAVHDFGRFDDRLSTLRYDAPGAPALAECVAASLAVAGIPARRLTQGGLDHGIWTVLRYLAPKADIPVLPLAFDASQSPQQQFELGLGLASLRQEGVLVIGTGSITHNLRRVFAQGLDAPADPPEVAESAAFRGWMADRSAARDWPALFDVRRLAPHAVDMHPTDEHLLPWYVAAGAGGWAAPPRRIHDGVTHGCLGMDAYAFGPEAAALEAALAAAPATLSAAGPR